MNVFDEFKDLKDLFYARYEAYQECSKNESVYTRLERAEYRGKSQAYADACALLARVIGALTATA